MTHEYQKVRKVKSVFSAEIYSFWFYMFLMQLFNTLAVAPIPARC